MAAQDRASLSHQEAINHMVNEIVNHNCPDCKQPFESYLQQPLSAASTQGAYWISTCKTPGCTYEGVTLDDSQWSKLITDPTMQAKYREQVAITRMSVAELRAYYTKAGAK